MRLLAVLLATVIVAWPSAASAQVAQFCRAGEVPQFTFGFATLKAELGATMGEPVECAHPNSANGDVLQQTTTGLSFWRKATNTPTFTDGNRHWGLTPGGMAYWEGAAVDPPGARATAPTAARERIHAVSYLPTEQELGYELRSGEQDTFPQATYARREFFRAGGSYTFRYFVFVHDTPLGAERWANDIINETRRRGMVFGPMPNLGDQAVAGTQDDPTMATFGTVFQVGSVACFVLFSTPYNTPVTTGIETVVTHARLVEAKARGNPTGYR